MVLVVAACGSSGSSQGSVSAGSSPSNQELSALGTPNAATGSPIKIGLFTNGKSPALATQSEETQQGAQIAVDYANAYLGGISGHKIELDVCEDQATPASATDCANRLVQDGVVAVVQPFNAFGAQQQPIITGAGIPYVIVGASTTTELTSKGSYVITGGYPGTLGAYAQYAHDNGVKKFAMITLDVPAATQAAQQIGGMVFKAVGIAYQVVTAPPGSPDISPQLQAAVSDGADALGVTGDVSFCTSFLQAYQAINANVPKFIQFTCVDPTVIKSLGQVLDGSILATTTASDPNNADARLYAAMLAKYAAGSNINPDLTVSANVATSLGAVMDLMGTLKGYKGNVTSAAISQRIAAAKNVPIFGSGNLTFTCDGKAIAMLPRVCSAQYLIGKVSADGTLQDAKPIDASTLFQAGA